MVAGVAGSSVIVARWLGPDGFGALAVLNATVALSVQIGNAGLSGANTYFIAKDRKNLGPAWANAVVFALGAGTLLAASVVLLASASPSLFRGVPAGLLAIAALSIPFQLLILLGLNVLLAMDRIAQLNLLDALSSAVILLNAVVVLIILRANLTTLVSLNTAAAIVLSLSLIWVVARILAVQKQRHTYQPDFRLLNAMLAYGIKFYISLMAGALIFRADLLIVNLFRGAGAAGVYAAAAQVSFLLMMLPAVIATLLFPRVAADQDQTGNRAIRVTRHASFVTFVMCVVGAGAAFTLPLIYGEGFADATIQLLILLPGVYLISVESVLVQHFTGTGLPPAIPIFWLITLAVNLGLNLALVPAFGARGAAAASTVSYALIFVLVAAYFCRSTNRTAGEILLLRKSELRELFRPARFAALTKGPE